MFIFSNITMPFGCTMDFRYIVPTILFGIVFIAKGIEDTKFVKSVSIVVYLFAVMSIIFEMTYMRYLTI